MLPVGNRSTVARFVMKRIGEVNVMEKSVSERL